MGMTITVSLFPQINCESIKIFSYSFIQQPLPVKDC